MTEFVRSGDILGDGTYGTVYAINIRGRPEQGALKEMYYEHTLSGFGNIREIEILSKLSRNCKFIPRIYFVHINNYVYKPINVEEEKRTEFISFACELAESDGVKFFRKISNYDIRTGIKLASQLLLAVSHMHNKDIYHRDIKPGNILITRDANGQPLLKLCDFGFSTYNSNNCSRSSKIQTPWYRAPEVVWRVSNYKMTSDIWSVGCTIYEILTGEVLMKRIGDYEKNPSLYFDECIRIIPKEWTEETQRIYRKYSGLKDMKVLGKTAIRRIQRSVTSFMPRFRQSARFREADIEIWENANKLLCDCFEFNYRERKTADEILSEPYFDDYREYIEDELEFQKREVEYEQIKIDIPEELNQKKIQYFTEAYQRLNNKVSMRVFFHAVDLANIFLTTFPDTTHDPNNIFAASLYYFEKFFSILTFPELPTEFFFKTFTPEELEKEETFRFIDKFIYDFEKVVINKTKLIGLRTYRDVLYEMQDHYLHYLSYAELEQLFFAFCEIGEWDNRKSYRYMYRYLYNKLFDSSFPVNLDNQISRLTNNENHKNTQDVEKLQ